MKRTVFLLGIAGASLMTVAACSEQSAGNNVAAENGLGIDSNLLANVAGEIAPANQSANASMSENASEAPGSAEQNGPTGSSPTAAAPAPRAEPATPVSRPRAATQAPADRPARAEPSAARPASKQEPSAPPTSTCTAEHEAMGHCKQ